MVIPIFEGNHVKLFAFTTQLEPFGTVSSIAVYRLKYPKRIRQNIFFEEKDASPIQRISVSKKRMDEILEKVFVPKSLTPLIESL